MLKGAALLTCFNRKRLTLECVGSLLQQCEHESYSMTVYLVDDGSSDGTSEAIRQEYPHVNIIRGDGSLYWNGGMRVAWETALDSNYDFYLWVNDDSMIFPDTVLKLVKTYKDLSLQFPNVGAIVGTMTDPHSNVPTYGGRLFHSKFTPLKIGDVIVPKNIPQQCDMMNGNLTLIPAASVEKIGILSDRFTHGLGDFDYSFRLANAGLQCWVAPGVHGNCPKNSIDGTWKDSKLKVSERLQLLKRPNQHEPTSEFLYFIRLHGGYGWPLLWAKIWVKGKLPILWVLKR